MRRTDMCELPIAFVIGANRPVLSTVRSGRRDRNICLFNGRLAGIHQPRNP